MKKKSIIITLIICILLAVIASVLASTHPDGLEWVAGKLGFLDIGEGKDAISSPLPDYTIPWIKNSFTSGAVAGIFGTLITFIVVYIVSRIIKSKTLRAQRTTHGE